MVNVVIKILENSSAMGVCMKCAKCGKFKVKIREGYYYCKACNLVYWYLIPGAKPRILVMNNSKTE